MIKIYENLDINNLENEVWKTINEYPKYQVSNFGRVKSFYKHNGTNIRILKPYQGKDGRLYVTLCQNKIIKKRYIHILIFETFNNYKLKFNECVHHIDFDYKNNYYLNLMKMTKFEHLCFHNKYRIISDETKRKVSEHHSYQKGTSNNNSKLITQDVIQIKLLLLNNKITQRRISNIFEVDYRTISSIKIGTTWSHIKI